MIICASLSGYGLPYGVDLLHYALYYLQNPDMIARILTITFQSAAGRSAVRSRSDQAYRQKRQCCSSATPAWLSAALSSCLPSNNIAWNTVAAVCCGICLSFTYSVIWGILPDTANYGEWKTGIRATGFYLCHRRVCPEAGQRHRQHGRRYLSSDPPGMTLPSAWSRPSAAPMASIWPTAGPASC